ncbi:uncharacterized protein BDW70DRAFT_1464 [Aspergillus foveolatus]|uniref:uncharacterized protein n=1 Tax=Aspergillus foveolatus TaxID=210207 RepID=UPI003CCD79A3
MLRLEAEFAKRPGAREYEIKERRWLRPRTDGQIREKRPSLHSLHIAVVDFERSDWRLEIRALEFHEAHHSTMHWSHSQTPSGFNARTTSAISVRDRKRKSCFPQALQYPDTWRNQRSVIVSKAPNTSSKLQGMMSTGVQWRVSAVGETYYWEACQKLLIHFGGHLSSTRIGTICSAAMQT